MADGDEYGSTADWIDDRSRAGPYAQGSRVEVFTDIDTDTVTFVWDPCGDAQTTTAWLTADADLVVSASDMQ